MERQNINFERPILKVGGSLAITLPQEIINYLELKEGTKIEMMGEKGSKGKYASIWKKDK